MSDVMALTCLSSADVLALTMTRVSRQPDETALLKVNDEVYEISKGRLAERSGFFRDLFAIPQPSVVVDEKTPILVDVGEPEWKAFVWFVLADPLAAEQFSTSPASIDKCARYLGMAVVAHRYDAMDVARWAIDKALGMLKQTNRSFQLNVELARLLVAVSSRWHEDANSAIMTDSRDLICDALSPARAGELAWDPISALEIARDDKYVLAHVYFYILRKGFDYKWNDDSRLQPVDRRRLLCGAYSLSRQNMWATGSFPPGSTKFPASQFRLPRSAAASQPAAASKSTPTSQPASTAPTASVPQPREIAPSQGVSGSASPAPPAPNGLVIFAPPARPTASQAPQPGGAETPQPQAPLPWRPEIDWQIARVRDELWSYFDEERWALSA